MTKAIFGLIGVLIGSGISWFQTYWINKRTENRNAKYLAIRVVCILDKYLEDCADVIKDDGLSFGQRTPEGYLKPQVKVPPPPIFPDDVDWKSIDHELMYKILSFPSDIEAGDRIIDFTDNISSPPDFSEWFEERKFHYCQFGLNAYKLSEELTLKYNIKKKTYNDWNPVPDLVRELNIVTEKRQKRIKSHRLFVNKVLGNK
ncbi:hypothetical protein [Flavobacterium sp. FlaQc-50]|jgi:hypothetical protein|uniref:hypothetical protein n=1 Tax=unclassified Flavobacterium TaxID=196869 RepID=UPI003756580D